MDMLFIFIVVVSFLGAFFAVGHMIQLDKFGEFVRADIKRVRDARVYDNRNDEPWPDVGASFQNLKWFDIFNYDFKSMMVYDQAK
jgi:hypothetical protein